MESKRTCGCAGCQTASKTKSSSGLTTYGSLKNLQMRKKPSVAYQVPCTANFIWLFLETKINEQKTGESTTKKQILIRKLLYLCCGATLSWEGWPILMIFLQINWKAKLLSTFIWTLWNGLKFSKIPKLAFFVSWFLGSAQYYSLQGTTSAEKVTRYSKTVKNGCFNIFPFFPRGSG